MVDNVIRWPCAISFKLSQNGSSRLTLVLCPPMTIERFTTSDFIGPSSVGRNKMPPAYCNTVAGGFIFMSSNMYLL
jgi:hypothetical protein